MRPRGARAVLVVCLALGLPATAAAQEADVPYDPAIGVQLFEYAIGPKTFFAVDDAAIAANEQLALDLMVTFLRNPFTIYDVDEDEDMIVGPRTRVVESMLAGEISGAYGLRDKFQLGVALPLVFSMTGEGLDPATAMPAGEGLQVTGLGDLRAEIKASLWRSGALALAGAAGITLPTSFGAGGSEFIGDDLPSARGRVALQWRSADGRLSAGVDAGTLLRKPRTIYASEVGQQLTWGAAAAYGITDEFSIVAETFGRTGMTAFDVDASPMEAGGGLRLRATDAFAVVLGGSAGVLRGIGSPDLRVFASVGYAPDTRDTDGDGVANNRDRCVLVPEDVDGFEDRDGCPDDDNDGDRREDAIDRCPAQAEDIDGHEDDDGCPELDNDGDGIPDLEDRFCPFDKEDGQGHAPSDGCPIDKRDFDVDGVYDHLDACHDQEEDVDEFEDWDGCPDADNDGDGVADDADQCGLCKEDRDGVADDDGCPELDVDADGIADEQDRCPSEAEVVNSVDDWDGCPDEGGAEVATFDGDRITFRGAVGFDRKGLTKAGVVLLDQAALLMLQHPEVTSWAIAVVARKDRDARKRAEWVIRHLVGRGVPVDRLQLLTSTGDAAVGIVVQERTGAEGDAPVCPAGAEVTPRPAPTGAAPPAAPEPTASEPAPAPAPEPTPAPEPADDELELE